MLPLYCGAFSVICISSLCSRFIARIVGRLLALPTMFFHVRPLPIYSVCLTFRGVLCSINVCFLFLCVPCAPSYVALYPFVHFSVLFLTPMIKFSSPHFFFAFDLVHSFVFIFLPFMSSRPIASNVCGAACLVIFFFQLLCRTKTFMLASTL
uniref:Uncharacterized protein n=1 Tax=Rhipicephalus pulchellus TaxID=72859 RepID=L7LX75_RHIPC